MGGPDGTLCAAGAQIKIENLLARAPHVYGDRRGRGRFGGDCGLLQLDGGRAYDNDEDTLSLHKRAFEVYLPLVTRN